ncbi:hypothetical protein QZH41_007125 [Actinostola sp. cb2023]|nr:hypothetical protein QZH41_007125 [Actinostola sp. cb2023]
MSGNMTLSSTGDWTLASVVVMGCWLSIVIFIGVFGNILVIIVSVQGTRVRTRGKSLIVSMACADMLESLNMIFILITAISYGEWIFGDVMCTLHGFVTIQFIITSVFSLMAISVNRYFMVVKSNHYKKVFSDRNLTMMITFIWIFPLVFAVPPLLGWSKYEFQSNKATCIFYFSTSMSYAISLMAFSVPLPLSIIVFCCYKIFVQVRQHKTRVQAIGTSGNVNVEEIRITKTLIIIIVAYLVCFIPPAVANLIEMGLPNYRIPFWVDVISMNLVFTNHANNPVIYGFFNRQYRQAFKELFCRLTPGRIDCSSTVDAIQEKQLSNIEQCANAVTASKELEGV